MASTLKSLPSKGRKPNHAKTGEIKVASVAVTPTPSPIAGQVFTDTVHLSANKKPSLGSTFNHNPVKRIQKESQAFTTLKELFGDTKGLALYGLLQELPDEWTKLAFVNNIVDAVNSKGKKSPVDVIQWKVYPVSVREFVVSPFYLDKKDEVYPALLDELEVMNNGDYVEVVHTGGIGSAKTTGALYSQAYQLYLLSCMENPHQAFGLDSSSEILIVFQSLNAKLAKDLDYARFRALIEGSPYFRTYFPFRKDLESKLVFPNRIEVVPINGSETGAIGKNVIGGIIDEVNFMALVENSKQSSDGTGTYSQAHALYTSIARRRKTRFSKQGTVAGLLCLVSSKRYPDQFTDQKEAEAKSEIVRQGYTRIYVYDKRVWDVKPKGSFLPTKFPIFIGDESRKPRILTHAEAKEIEATDDKHLVDWIPDDFRTEFETDIIKAIQDIAGHSKLAKHPFLVNVEAVAKCFKSEHKPVVINPWVDFVTEKATVFPDRIVKKHLPRFAHIDLSLSGDSTGVAIGYVDSFITLDRGDHYETMPNIVMDVVLEVKPPQGGEILYWKVRQLLYTLRQMGMDIKWVSLDSYQSTDMMQILRSKGFVTGMRSMDTSTMPYEYLKSCLYDGRLTLPKHDLLKKELLSLERDAKKDKIDHPATSSKDVADAVAGVVFGLTTRREIWSLFNVPLVQAPIPVQNLKENMKSGEPA